MSATSKTISKKAMRDYVQLQGSGCLKCGSSDVEELVGIDADDPFFLKRPMECQECGFQFDEVYQLTGFKHEGLKTTYYPDEDDVVIRLPKKGLKSLIGKLDVALETLNMDAVSGSFDQGAKKGALKGAEGVSTILSALDKAKANNGG